MPDDDDDASHDQLQSRRRRLVGAAGIVRGHQRDLAAEHATLGVDPPNREPDRRAIALARARQGPREGIGEADLDVARLGATGHQGQDKRQDRTVAAGHAAHLRLAGAQRAINEHT